MTTWFDVAAFLAHDERMDWTVAAAADLLGFKRLRADVSNALTVDLERQVGRGLPRSVRALLAHDGLLEALADTYGAQPVLSAGAYRLTADDLPGVTGDVLWLMTENQGVCVWGAPLDAGDDPPVLVGGDLADSDSPSRYADSVNVFAYSWAWDQVLLSRATVLQAQAAELDADTESFLAARLTRGPTTWGWPCRRNLRFGAEDGTCIELWDCPGQCDWLISAPDTDAVARWVRELLPYSDLRSSLWSSDHEGEKLLARVRASS